MGPQNRPPGRDRRDSMYQSQAQEAFFNVHKKKLEKQGVDVDEWNQASKGKTLPPKAPKPPENKSR